MSSTTPSPAQIAAEKAEFEIFAEARAASIVQAKYYAAAIVGLVAVFIISHWIQVIFVNVCSRSNSFSRAVASISKPVRRFLKGSVIGSVLVLPGRILLALVYVGINLTLTFTRLDLPLYQVIFAKRCGWMALLNLSLVMFLALKNTPLSPLAGRSYESINVLHRVCGYTVIVFVTLHASVYVPALADAHALMVLAVPGQHAAAVAGFSFLTIGITAFRFVRKRQYELFFIVHVTLVTVILISLIFHTKQFGWSAIAIVIVAASMWFADRSLRFSRWIYHGYGNYATLTALPEGATRVTMNRSIKAQPGSHAFLWIPGVRPLQTHPFTLVANDPADFVVSAQNGFTRELHELALQKPKTMCRASIEGPYGNVPSTEDFDKVVLVAGGSGATFTFALAMDWIRKKRHENDNRTLDFIWSVKNKDYLDWFDVELLEMQNSPWVNLRINLTAGKISKSDISPPSTAVPTSDSNEQEKTVFANGTAARSSDQTSLSRLIERGRPNVSALVKNAVDSVPQDASVLVAASGPSGLLSDARLATSACITSDAPGVHLHLEEFDW